jgi:hypothetical protein
VLRVEQGRRARGVAEEATLHCFKGKLDWATQAELEQLRRTKLSFYRGVLAWSDVVALARDRLTHVAPSAPPPQMSVGGGAGVPGVPTVAGPPPPAPTVVPAPVAPPPQPAPAPTPAPPAGGAPNNAGGTRPASDRLGALRMVGHMRGEEVQWAADAIPEPFQAKEGLVA